MRTYDLGPIGIARLALKKVDSPDDELIKVSRVLMPILANIVLEMVLEMEPRFKRVQLIETELRDYFRLEDELKAMRRRARFYGGDPKYARLKWKAKTIRKNLVYLLANEDKP